MNPLPLVTFSHLRWEVANERPQHVMTRIAAKRPVLFVEEPVLGAGEPTLELESVVPGVTVARPVLPANGAAYSVSQEVVIVGLLKKQLAKARWNRIATWLYTPMAVRMAKALHPRAILYDCMDDLSGFLNAPPEIAARERELIAAANAVMTGGAKSLPCEERPALLCAVLPEQCGRRALRESRGRCGTGGPAGDPSAASGLLRGSR